MADVWLRQTVDEQRRCIAQIFGLEDGPGVCIEAVTLDELVDLLRCCVALFTFAAERMVSDLRTSTTFR